MSLLGSLATPFLLVKPVCLQGFLVSCLDDGNRDGITPAQTIRKCSKSAQKLPW